MKERKSARRFCNLATISAWEMRSGIALTMRSWTLPAQKMCWWTKALISLHISGIHAFFGQLLKTQLTLGMNLKMDEIAEIGKITLP